MSNTVFSFLEFFSEAAVLLRDGRVLACSPMARHYLPQLEPGQAAPAGLPDAPAAGGGVFTAGLSSYSYTCTPLEEGQLLVFRPAPQSVLTDGQLDGTLRQLRQFMGEFLLELPDHLHGAEGASFRKSFYRLFRLLGNLECLQESWEQSQPRATMDLAGLCRQTAQEAAPLLAQGGVTLEFSCPDASLFIPGDPGLLQRMVLELIANSARAAAGGTVRLSLRSQGGRALLTVSDTGAEPTPRQLAALLQQDTDQAIPAPGAGAGLGLSVVRRVVALHRGALLVEWGQGAPTTLISLPAGPLDPHATLGSPILRRDGGLSPVLTALADVLPTSVFLLAELD